MRSTITVNYSWSCTKHFRVSFISPLLNWDKENKEKHKTLIKPKIPFYFSLNLTNTRIFFLRNTTLVMIYTLLEKRDKFPRTLCPWKGSSSFVSWIKVAGIFQNAGLFFFFLQQINIFHKFWENSPFCIKSLWAIKKVFLLRRRKSLYLKNFKSS